MMREKYYILIAEGITDCSLLEAVPEKYLQFETYDNIKDLPQVFQKMIGKYPAETGELTRQDSPVFYHKNEIAIAVKQAGGCSNIAKKASLLVEVIDQLSEYEKFGGFLLFCDTDTENSESIRTKLKEEFEKEGFLYEADILEAYEQKISCKLYLFPSEGCGAIEKLLLECASKVYGELSEEARKFKESILQDSYDGLRHKCWAKDEKVQEFYADKVQFGAISTVLKPDRPVRFTIKDKLIKKKYKDLYMGIPEFAVLYEFLDQSFR